jgi:hypothetical protein
MAVSVKKERGFFMDLLREPELHLYIIFAVLMVSSSYYFDHQAQKKYDHAMAVMTPMEKMITGEIFEEKHGKKFKIELFDHLTQERSVQPNDPKSFFCGKVDSIWIHHWGKTFGKLQSIHDKSCNAG